MCVCMCTQSCPTVCNLMDCNPPGSSVHGIFQARNLEWVVISFPRWSFQPRDRNSVSCIPCTGRQSLHHLHHLGNPQEKAAIWYEKTDTHPKFQWWKLILLAFHHLMFSKEKKDTSKQKSHQSNKSPFVLSKFFWLIHLYVQR